MDGADEFDRQPTSNSANWHPNKTAILDSFDHDSGEQWSTKLGKWLQKLQRPTAELKAEPNSSVQCHHKSNELPDASH